MPHFGNAGECDDQVSRWHAQGPVKRLHVVSWRIGAEPAGDLLGQPYDCVIRSRSQVVDLVSDRAGKPVFEHGIPYITGPLPRQYASTWARIWRMALP